MSTGASDIPSLLFIVVSFGLSFATRDEKTGHFMVTLSLLHKGINLASIFKYIVFIYYI